MNAPSFFALANEYAALDEVMDGLDADDGADAAAAAAAVRAYLDSLDGDFKAKLERAAVYLDLQRQAQRAAEERAEKAKAMALTHRRREERLRAAILDAMVAAKLDKVETSEATFSLQKTAPAVVVDDAADLAALPADCVRVKTEANKTALKARLEAGETIPGVTLSTPRLTLRVK